MSRRRATWLLSIFLVFTALASLASAGWMARYALTPARPGIKETVLLEVRRGQPPGEITRNLVQKGVIEDAKLMLWLGRLLRSWGRLKAGEYRVSASMTPLEVIRVLESGVSVRHPVTITEGMNMYQVADLLEAKGFGSRKRFLELCRSEQLMRSLGFMDPLPPSLEGYLFPETYGLERSATQEQIVRRMFRQFESSWTPAHERRAAELGLTRHQVVILASMVEKETGYPGERATISSVFHNRLRKRMRLQSDPTTIYGMWERYTGAIGRADLARRSPYNTYTVDALPAGPIANPGKEAIHATLYPAATDYLYFVSQNDGRSVFSRTLEEHNSAVRKYQLDPKAREGKSWRDLTRKNGARRK